MADRRGISFRDSAITFGFMTAVVVVLAVVVLVLLDPRAQAFWGAKFSDLGTAARTLVNNIPWLR
jgi:preprotein translocase subunit SecG